jgi:hypothetical protein
VPAVSNTCIVVATLAVVSVPSPKYHFHSVIVAPPEAVDATPLNCTVVAVDGAVGNDVKLAVTPLPTMVKSLEPVPVWPRSSESGGTGRMPKADTRNPFPASFISTTFTALDPISRPTSALDLRNTDTPATKMTSMMRHLYDFCKRRMPHISQIDTSNPPYRPSEPEQHSRTEWETWKLGRQAPTDTVFLQGRAGSTPWRGLGVKRLARGANEEDTLLTSAA